MIIIVINMDNLPIELLEMINDKLDPASSTAFRLTCKTMITLNIKSFHSKESIIKYDYYQFGYFLNEYDLGELGSTKCTKYLLNKNKNIKVKCLCERLKYTLINNYDECSKLIIKYVNEYKPRIRHKFSILKVIIEYGNWDIFNLFDKFDIADYKNHIFNEYEYKYNRRLYDLYIDCCDKYIYCMLFIGIIYRNKSKYKLDFAIKIIEEYKKQNPELNYICGLIKIGTQIFGADFIKSEVVIEIIRNNFSYYGIKALNKLVNIQCNKDCLAKIINT